MAEPKLTFGTRFRHILVVNDPNPDIARRGWLLNVLLLGTFVGAVGGAAAALVASIVSGWSDTSEVLVLVAGAIAALFTLGLYFLNRSGKVRPAAIIFLLGLLVLVSFSDEPAQLDCRTFDYCVRSAHCHGQCAVEAVCFFRHGGPIGCSAVDVGAYERSPV